MNIAFLANFYKTIFFKSIADSLESEGYNVYWISTSIKWKKWLIKKGVSKNKILLLQKNKAKIKNKKRFYSLANNIESANRINIKSLILMDRVVSKWQREEADQYLGYVFENIYNFLESKNIKVVFGESTYLHEVATSLICQYLNRNFFCPFTLRIPSDRFVFFKGHLQKEFQLVSGDTDTDYEEKIKSIIKSVIEGDLKPNYWHWSNKIPKMSLELFLNILKKIIEGYKEAKFDATVKSIGYHLKYERKFLKPVRYFLTKKLHIFEQPKNEKFVLMTLHKQPEASIDVLGNKYSNQLELIRRISRLLPYNVSLYVKEHPNCLGERSLSELKKIRKYPGVRLIDPFYNMNTLIRDALIVITVSGTVAFEAGLFNKKAVTFSPMFFNKLSSVEFLDSVERIPDKLKEIEQNNFFGGEDKKDEKVLIEMLSNSFEGVISDPKTTSLCMEPQNIKKVSYGFKKLLASLDDIK